MEEIWNNIEGYEGLYQISNFGNVRSLNYRRSGETKVLKPRKNTKGYLYVGLYKNKTYKQFRIHRLVASAFLDNPCNLPQVNHIDECKTNNCVENLEWCTSEYNNNYGSHTERAGKALSKKVYQYTLAGELVKEWVSTISVERELGYANQNISACCIGKRKKSHNFIWSYTKL